MLSAESNAAATQRSPISPLYDDAIQKFKTSTYFRVHPESFPRTIIDILLCSRLEVLGDNTANRRLRVHSEFLSPLKLGTMAG